MVRSCVARRVLALAAVTASTAAACATPTIPEVIAPATATPIPEPTATPAPTVEDQPTPTPAPFESQPGVTADQIRIGVIIDVGGGEASDGLAASAAEAVEAWANAVNLQGGLAGREVVVERIATDPLLDDHAEAIDRACNLDIFALVGSSAVFDSEGLDQLQSPGCGLPDFPATVSSIERLESAVTTAPNPIHSTQWSAGWARYYAETEPETVERAATMLLEFPVTVVMGERMIEAATAQGYEFVYRPEIAFDTTFEDEVAALVEADAAMLTWRNDGDRLVQLLGRLDEEGVELEVDCALACYSATWVDLAGELGEGVQAWLPTLPVEDAAGTPELLRYLFQLGATHGNDAEPTSVGIMAWSAGLLFEEAVNMAIGAGTADYDPDTLTRAGVLAAADQITAWDGRGLHGEANPAEGIPSPCFVLLTLTDGVWERAFPERRGELDCNPDNLVALTITPTLGAEEDPTPAPEDGDDPSEE